MKKILFSIIALFAICTSSSQVLALESQKIVMILKKQAEQIKVLNAKIDSLEQQVEELKARDNVSAKKNINDDVNVAIDHDQAPSIDEAKKMYDIALAALKDRNYTIAEHDFKEFVKLYPEHKLTGRALFWLGESQFRREMYDNAAVNFLKSYKTEPTGVKSSDALLKLSISLSHLNKHKESCAMLSKLNHEFPNRSDESIKKAQDLKAKLKCK